MEGLENGGWGRLSTQVTICTADLTAMRTTLRQTFPPRRSVNTDELFHTNSGFSTSMPPPWRQMSQTFYRSKSNNELDEDFNIYRQETHTQMRRAKQTKRGKARLLLSVTLQSSLLQRFTSSSP